MEIDYFVDRDLETEINGVDKITGEYPLRNFDVIEFYKVIKEKQKIIFISFDIENHIISFHVRARKKVGECGYEYNSFECQKMPCYDECETSEFKENKE
jgi:hypothetical protein